MIATTSHTGAVTARYSYDPFGKRRNVNGTYDPFGNIVIDWAAGTAAGTDRGYTGHEHLDDAGIIHMNGRIFDPVIARFLQADPFIQAPGNLQNYDRYAYCFNSPATCTDPSGYLSLFGKRILPGLFNNKNLRIAVAAAAAWYLGPASLNSGSWTLALFESTMANAAVAGFTSGTILSGSLKGGIQGAFSGMVFAGVGDYLNGAGLFEGGAKIGEWSLQGIALHGVAGCVSSVASEVKCGPGFLSAAFSQAALPLKGDGLAGLISSTIIGGTASVLGGGKFSNGAQTAAFGYLFNECAHTRMCGSSSTKVEIQGNVAGGDLGELTDPASLHLSISISDGYSGLTVLNGQPRGPGWFCMLCLNSAVSVATHGPIVWGPYTLATPASMTNTSFANALVANANRYTNYLVPYSMPSLPTGDMNSWQFNSNSWVAGLLNRTMGTIPAYTFTPYQAPGYMNPVPNWTFRKRP